MTRTGKIAKLPKEIREELNHQLEHGVPGRVLAAWLNAQPAVQAVLREFFAGASVNEQNLSAWRRGGFADWQTRREFFDQVREVAADTGDFEKVAAKMADHAAQLLASHYAIALSSLPPSAASSRTVTASEPSPYASLTRLKPLVSLTRHVVALRRSEHSAARLKMEEWAFAFAHRAHSVAESTLHPPANPASLTPGTPALPDPAEGETQPKSSQIKAEETRANPTAPTARNTCTPPSTHPPEKPPASPSPPRLKLTFPPLPQHLSAGPSLPAQVA